MSVPAQGPITLYAPKRNLPIEVPARIIGKKHFHFRSKLKVILPVLLFSGLIGGIYPFVDDVRAVLTQGGSAVTLDAVLDENFNLSLAGNLEGSQLISTTTDSAPLVVNSTGLVADLNADLLDGQHGSYYLDLDNETGTCANCLTTTEINESTFTGLNFTNISDIYLLNNGDTATGDYNFDDDVTL